jgi:hypothetical protein
MDRLAAIAVVLGTVGLAFVLHLAVLPTVLGRRDERRRRLGVDDPVDRARVEGRVEAREVSRATR